MSAIYKGAAFGGYFIKAAFLKSLSYWYWYWYTDTSFKFVIHCWKVNNASYYQKKLQRNKIKINFNFFNQITRWSTSKTYRGICYGVLRSLYFLEMTQIVGQVFAYDWNKWNLSNACVYCICCDVLQDYCTHLCRCNLGKSILFKSHRLKCSSIVHYHTLSKFDVIIKGTAHPGWYRTMSMTA